MTPEQWKAVACILDAALELPEDERPSLLQRACGNDAEVRFHVEEALAAMGDPDGDPIADAIWNVAEQFVQEGSLPSGARLGAYRLIEEIGRGGMGTVYLAERDDDEFHRRVAIKVVKNGMANSRVLSRFRQERRILARLDHPYIARIVDGGTTPDGLPYLVMDYVQGLPIDEYCNRHHLSLSERLRLFRHVCSAVEYAHQNLVVHRDLKPSNIMVDESGAPRLLDFGIAKLLESETGEAAATMTMDSLRLLTPRYASPEQVSGQAISTASDIYSLGTILYELLTATPAHRINSLDPASLFRIICEEEAPAPSVAAREGNPPVQSQHLSGDLDNILLTSLRKEPRHRYQSVEQFSDDLERFLEYRPVRARPRTARYRMAKFVRRNRGTVVATSIAVALLVGGVILSNYQARRAERRFDQVRKLAHSFLFDIHDLLEGVAGSTVAREAMVRTALEYLDGLARESGGDPALQWELATAYQRIGDLQGYAVRPNLGRPLEALASHKKALAIAQQVSGRNPSAEHRAFVAQEFQRIGYILNATGKAAVGREFFVQGLEVADALESSRPGDPRFSQILMSMLADLGELERSTGNTEAAVRLNFRTVEVAQRWFDLHPSDQSRGALATGHHRASQALSYSGDLEGALRHAAKAIEIREPLTAAKPRDANLQRQLMNAYEQYGTVLFHGDKLNLEDRAAAQPYYQKVLAIAEKLSAADPNNVGALSDLAIATRNACWSMVEDEPRRALEICREGLEIMQRGLSIQERYRGRLLASSGVAQQKLGNREEARTLFTRSTEVFQAIVSRDRGVVEFRQDLLRSRNLLGGLLLELGDEQQAMDQLRSALSAAEALSGERPADLLRLHDAADCYERMGKYYEKRDWQQARDWYRKSLNIWSAWPRSAPSTRMDRIHRERAARLVAQCDAKLVGR